MTMKNIKAIHWLIISLLLYSPLGTSQSAESLSNQELFYAKQESMVEGKTRALQEMYCDQAMDELDDIRSIMRSEYRTARHKDIKERKKTAMEKFLIHCI